MSGRAGRLGGALSLLALLVLVAAGLANAGSPPGTPIGPAKPGKVQKVGQAGPGTAAPVTKGTHAIGYRLTAKLTATGTPSTASGQWDGLLIHTIGTVHAGAMPSIPGCKVMAPRPGGPGQSPPRASGMPHQIKCGGPATVPPFSVPGSGQHWILGWKMSFSGLSGAATGTDIRLNAPGAAGTLATTLCAPCTSGKFGRATLTDDQANAVVAGHGYVVVNTATNPTGEIAGAITKAARTATGH